MSAESNATLARSILARADSAREQLLAEVHGAAADELEFRPDGRWSVRQILLHLAQWEELLTRSTEQARRGEPTAREAIADLNGFNNAGVAERDHLDLSGALALLAGTRERFAAAVAAVPPEGWRTSPAALTYARTVAHHDMMHLHHIRENLARARGRGAEAAVHYLGYARQRIINRVDLALERPAALDWRPAPDKWSIRGQLLHLSVWDRQWSRFLAALHHGEVLPLPYAPGGLDQWNREQVAALAHLTPAEVLHEWGAARGALTEQLARLTPELLAHPNAPTWLAEVRDHDLHHLRKITELLRQAPQ